ncbi:MAG: CcmD family protein [Desulfobacterales bacterium]|nr:CcmD family protein [Desulfobacterales bacterium]
MAGTLYLFAAFSITWFIIFIYIFSISRRQKTLEREIEKISRALGDHS